MRKAIQKKHHFYPLKMATASFITSHIGRMFTILFCNYGSTLHKRNFTKTRIQHSPNRLMHVYLLKSSSFLREIAARLASYLKSTYMDQFSMLIYI